MRFSSVLKLCLSASPGMSALAQAESDDRKAFPLAESGFQRHVIRVPAGSELHYRIWSAGEDEAVSAH